MSNSVLAELQNVSVSLDGRELLHDVQLQLHSNEIVSLIGPNGAGKTTLLRVLLGMQAVSTGKVKLRKGLRIGYMPQRLKLSASLPIMVKGFLALAAKVTDNEIMQALSLSGAEHLLQRQVTNLSGGEMQKVLLARCMLRKPELLVLDEPAQGVDLSGQEELYQKISAIRDRTACGVLMVSHDLHLVMSSTDKVICLNHHVCCTGKPESVQTHPEYLRLFGDSAEAFAIYTHHHDHQHDDCGEVIHRD